MTQTQVELAQKAREVVQHYLDTMGVNVDDIAEEAGVAPSRLRDFQRGSLILAPEEFTLMGNLFAELSEGEEWDAFEARRYGQSIRTARDIAEGR